MSAALALALGLLAANATSLRRYREGVLAHLAEVVRFDGALFHAMSPRVPLETAVIVGLDVDVLRRSLRTWDDLAVALSPMRDGADLVVTDQVFVPGSRARATFDRSVARPLGHRSMCMMHLSIRGALVGGVVLFAKRRDAFDRRATATLRTVAPLVAACDALHQRLDAVPRASQRVRLRCRDERLTARQRDIVEHVALGRTNAEIARALDLSPNTVRNHLARIATRLDAGNRADMVRLAILLPAS